MIITIQGIIALQSTFYTIRDKKALQLTYNNATKCLRMLINAFLIISSEIIYLASS